MSVLCTGTDSSTPEIGRTASSRGRASCRRPCADGHGALANSCSSYPTSPQDDGSTCRNRRLVPIRAIGRPFGRADLPSARQPVLQQHGGRTRVLGGGSRSPLCERGREALVVQRDRYVKGAPEALGERARLGRLGAVVPGERQREPDDDGRWVVLADRREQAVEALAGRGAQDRPERRRRRAGRGGDGGAAAGGPPSEGGDAAHAGAGYVPARTAALREGESIVGRVIT